MFLGDGMLLVTTGHNGHYEVKNTEGFTIASFGGDLSRCSAGVKLNSPLALDLASGGILADSTKSNIVFPIIMWGHQQRPAQPRLLSLGSHGIRRRSSGTVGKLQVGRCKCRYWKWSKVMDYRRL